MGGAIIRPTLILTRPASQAAAFAGAFRARFGADWPIITSPLTEIRYLTPAMDLTGCEAVIFTSANAVEGFRRLFPSTNLPALCVGARTAQAARAAGFQATEGPGDAQGLARQIIASAQARRLAYPHGAEIAFDISGMLESAGIETVSAVVYDQTRVAPSVELLRALGAREPLLLPLFSPASARRASAAMCDVSAPLYIAAMSDRVAQAARPLAHAALEVAAQPDAGAMLDALAALIAAAGSA
ncbi:uroporphyrinogen-III synthase [Defluviimonas sp. WL0002]|uniref:Uroporphyrinogen-III synthase n=1 Tax=Albidovulum marisflavi TaxID=2984159 RepID=A0ABT2Z7Y1_9RHOB|nr:uroporphyrinogen-III synthase [Defluviimonas sp. WL0002]MCV2867244.1 uroporphyrinogen-III synthase [Defluviimonas sp. WL0002]